MGCDQSQPQIPPKLAFSETENPNRVVVHINSSKEGWLFQADTWYPGWIAEVDGEVTSIQVANGAFRAVPVPVGNHTVVFDYQPVSFYLGFGLSLIAIIGLSIAARKFREVRND
jgi:uncharacterized membrane protein YfhO